jgi:ABC-type Mn2+/Zn2+ transport system permease subunit
MDLSILFQALGSLCVVIGYYLNSKSQPRQHMWFIFGHIFLICFTILEAKWMLLALSFFVIIMQYKISKRKYKFRKDIVRMKKVARKIKCD